MSANGAKNIQRYGFLAKIPVFLLIQTRCAMLKRILSLLLILTMLHVVIPVQAEEPTRAKATSYALFEYKVKAKETVFSLCKRFQISEVELLNLNPVLSNGLKKGQTLLIPLKGQTKNVLTDAKKEQAVSVTQNANKIEQTDLESKGSDFSKFKNNSVLPRISLLLPFRDNDQQGYSARYVEFYEGFLLAVDSLKNLGLSFEVQALESGDDAQTLSWQLNNGALDHSIYCIGGVNAEQIFALSAWAKKKSSYVVLPFSSRIPEINNNPYLIQTLPPQEFVFQRLSELVAKMGKESNVVFLGENKDMNDPRVQLLQQIKIQMKTSGVAVNSVVDDELFENLGKSLSTTKINRIIPVPMTIQETNNLLVRLEAFCNTNPEYKIAMFGYPDWVTIGKNYQKYLNNLDAIIYSSFYADFTKQNVRDFQVLYSRTFGKNMLNTYPKYAMLGYDIAVNIIPKMVLKFNHSNMEPPIFEPLQNAINLVSKGPINGLVNESFYLLNFNNDQIKVNVVH